MKYLLALFAGLMVSDGALTYFLVESGAAREGNPLLVPTLAGGSFLTLKVVSTIICTMILWDIYRRVPKLALISTSCIVVAYGAIVFWNFGVFLRA